MATKKIYDACVVTRTYTNNQGEEKRIYTNIGAVFQSDDGRLSMQLDRFFNPAGVPINPDRPDSGVWVSFFEPKPRDGYSTPPTTGPGTRQAAPPAPAPVDFDDDVPF